MASLGLSGDPFDALGDSNRRAIVELLGSGGRSVREIAEALPISRPAVSRHLRLLKDAGLVIDRPQGTRRIYQLHAEGVAAVEAYLVEVWGDAAARFRLLAENTRPPQTLPLADSLPRRLSPAKSGEYPAKGRGSTSQGSKSQAASLSGWGQATSSS